MTWATVTTGPERDAPEQRRQPVGTGKDGEETGSLGGVWKFFFQGSGDKRKPRGIGSGGVLCND